MLLKCQCSWYVHQQQSIFVCRYCVVSVWANVHCPSDADGRWRLANCFQLPIFSQTTARTLNFLHNFKSNAMIRITPFHQVWLSIIIMQQNWIFYQDFSDRNNCNTASLHVEKCLDWDYVSRLLQKLCFSFSSTMGSLHFIATQHRSTQTQSSMESGRLDVLKKTNFGQNGPIQYWKVILQNAFIKVKLKQSF